MGLVSAETCLVEGSAASTEGKKARGKGAEVGGEGVSDGGSASWAGAAGKGRPLQPHRPGGRGGTGQKTRG